MLIESIIQRAKGTYVPLGDDVYHFFTHIKGNPSHVCQVTDEDHIQTFLAIKEGYRIFKQPKKAEAEPDQLEGVAAADKAAVKKADAEVKKSAKKEAAEAAPKDE